MTDDELWDLYVEERRLYNAYVQETNGSTLVANQRISPERVELTRLAWVELHEKLRLVASVGEVRELHARRVEKEET